MRPVTAGLDRLCRAGAVDLSLDRFRDLDRLIDHLFSEVVPAGAGDDIAVLAIRRPLFSRSTGADPRHHHRPHLRRMAHHTERGD